MKKTRRTAKVGELIRDAIASILQRDIQDPAIRFVTITDVEISVDLRIARVFISVMGTDQERDETLAALEQQRGRIRHLVGQRVSLRTLPELSFRIDDTAAHAEEIERLLATIRPTMGPADDDDAVEDAEAGGKGSDERED